MAKLDLATLASGYLDVSKLNENFAKIELWADTVVSRNGAAPNQMEADLDLNGHSLMNIGDAVGDSALVTLSQMESYVSQRSSGLIRQQIETFTATAGQTTFTLTQFTYEPGTGNLAVYKNGVRLFNGQGYNEANTTQLILSVGATAGDKIQVVSNEFLATISLPAHTHPWTQITGVPVYTTRWPFWTEVQSKPTTFAPSPHTHATTDITSGNSFTDSIRGVFVQSTQPTATRVGDLWLN